MPQFTDQEKECLKELVSAKKEILDNPETNSDTERERRGCWEEIRNEFNSDPANSRKSCHDLKKIWKSAHNETRRDETRKKKKTSSKDKEPSDQQSIDAMRARNQLSREEESHRKKMKLLDLQIKKTEMEIELLNRRKYGD